MTLSGLHVSCVYPYNGDPANLQMPATMYNLVGANDNTAFTINYDNGKCVAIWLYLLIYSLRLLHTTSSARIPPWDKRNNKLQCYWNNVHTQSGTWHVGHWRNCKWLYQNQITILRWPHLAPQLRCQTFTQFVQFPKCLYWTFNRWPLRVVRENCRVWKLHSRYLKK